MLRARVKSRLNFPKLSTQKDLQSIAKNIVIPDIIKGIEKSVSIKGGRLPSITEATKNKKGRKGGDRPLIDTGELKKSFFYKNRGKNVVVISIKSGRKAIAGYLQIDGVGKIKKKFLFFGISKDSAQDAMAFMRRQIQKAIDRAKRTK